MSSFEECLFILHVYAVLHLYILIYFQDIDTGSLQIRLQVGLHKRKFVYHTLMILDNINGMWTIGVRHRDLVTVPSFNQDLPMHL